MHQPVVYSPVETTMSTNPATPTAPSSRQITSPLAIKTTNQSEAIWVITRLIEMGWANVVHYTSIDKMTKDWSDFPHIVVESQDHIDSRTFDRASDGFVQRSKLPIISTAFFLAGFGPDTPAAPAVATPAAPLNPPNFVVDTGGNKTLSRIVQELAFSAGIFWTDGCSSVENAGSFYLYMIRGKAPFPFETKGIMNSPESPIEVPADKWPVYDAATQMGEIVRLLSTPVKPPVPPAPTPPELYGYKAVYAAGADTIGFGCAEIPVNLLECVRGVMDKPQPGNRTLRGITLSSGKTLDRDGIGMALVYVAAVDEHTKKYPEKSP